MGSVPNLLREADSTTAEFGERSRSAPKGDTIGTSCACERSWLRNGYRGAAVRR